MRPGAAPHAASQGSQYNTEPAALAAVPAARCSGQRAPIAGKIPKCPLNLALAGGCTVAIAIVRSDFTGSAVLKYLAHTQAGVPCLGMSRLEFVEVL